MNATPGLIFAKHYTLLMIIFRYGCLIMRPTRFHIGATLRNENNSLRNLFIQLYLMLDTTGLNTQWKVVGREQDSGETDREIEKK